MKTLKQAAIGDTVKVVKLHGEGAVKRRLWIWVSQEVLKCIFVRLHRLVIRLRSQ